MSSFQAQLSARVQETEKIITAYLPPAAGEAAAVLEAARYSFLAGGKRLRPLFMREVYTALGGTGALVHPFMAAIEMIHTYSLIHDDLPAMDNDDFRRGKPTAHVVYGEAMAILAGDALLNLAFETALKAFFLTEEPERVCRALAVLAEKAGVRGMIGGQTADVAYEGSILAEDLLLSMYEKKTGALLSAAFMTGAILAGAPKETVSGLEEAAAAFGIAFQLRDDILDVTGSREKLGKPPHSDEKSQKCTYVSLKGLRESQALAARYTQTATKTVSALLPDAVFLQTLLESLLQREQ